MEELKMSEEKPPMPPGLPPMPPMPPAPPGLDAPAAPPGLLPMPPMDAPPAPPGMPPMPPMPEMDAPPMDAPPAPSGMPPMPPMPEMETEAPVEEQDLLSGSAALLGAPAPPAPPMASEESDLLSGSAALLDAPAPPEESGEIPPLPASLLPDPVLGAPDNLLGEQAGAVIRSSAEVDEVLGDKLEGTLHEIEKATLSADGEIIKQTVKGTLKVNNPSAKTEFMISM